MNYIPYLVAIGFVLTIAWAVTMDGKGEYQTSRQSSLLDRLRSFLKGGKQ